MLSRFVSFVIQVCEPRLPSDSNQIEIYLCLPFEYAIKRQGNASFKFRSLLQPK